MSPSGGNTDQEMQEERFVFACLPSLSLGSSSVLLSLDPCCWRCCSSCIPSLMLEASFKLPVWSDGLQPSRISPGLQRQTWTAETSSLADWETTWFLAPLVRDSDYRLSRLTCINQYNKSPFMCVHAIGLFFSWALIYPSTPLVTVDSRL